jgi:uroporphyrinogen-III synthase
MQVRPASPWYVISLRPRGEHAPMRRAAARHGAHVVALSPWALAPRTDARSRAGLHAALRATRVVFTSPAAVRAAHGLCARDFAPAAGATWIGVGAGTVAALRRAGVPRALSPARMDSDGVLALPALQDVRGAEVGVVTAPGGRDAIAPALRERGARVLRADVYDRVPLAPAARTLATLRTAGAGGVLAASSSGALEQALAALPPELAQRLRGLPLVVASERGAAHARALGFTRIGLAQGPGPEALVAAAAALASGSMG